MTDQTTPMMGQYRRIRGEVSPDTILFFRLGDFYEMFFDDAKEASQILDIALTKRQTVPMCGVPYHAADFYLAKLIKAGKKVAICDQMEDPATATRHRPARGHADRHARHGPRRKRSRIQPQQLSRRRCAGRVKCSAWPCSTFPPARSGSRRARASPRSRTILCAMLPPNA